jgi:hypothetical protein
MHKFRAIREIDDKNKSSRLLELRRNSECTFRLLPSPSRFRRKGWNITSFSFSFSLVAVTIKEIEQLYSRFSAASSTYTMNYTQFENIFPVEVPWWKSDLKRLFDVSM